MISILNKLMISEVSPCEVIGKMTAVVFESKEVNDTWPKHITHYRCIGLHNKQTNSLSQCLRAASIYFSNPRLFQRGQMAK